MIKMHLIMKIILPHLEENKLSPLKMHNVIIQRSRGTINKTYKIENGKEECVKRQQRDKRVLNSTRLFYY